MSIPIDVCDGSGSLLKEISSSKSTFLIILMGVVKLSFSSKGVLNSGELKEVIFGLSGTLGLQS